MERLITESDDRFFDDQPQASNDAYAKALVIARRLHDRVIEATLLTNIGANYSDLPNSNDKALNCFSEAITIFRELVVSPGRL
jgi:hypothetical protein